MIAAGKQLKAAGKLARIEKQIHNLKQNLEKLDLWLPAADLRHQAAKALELLAKIRHRLDRQVVITLVGPSGAGKSTLFNALAGRDEISPTGFDRPTTCALQVLCSDSTRAIQALGIENPETVSIHQAGGIDPTRQVVLVDTPDTDSVAVATHRPLVEKAVAAADVLVCVFDVENPKRRDNADFLAPLVNLFAGSNLIVALNKCDRQDRRELARSIVPGFRKYLAAAWQMEVNEVLAISARSHLNNPAWDRGLEPRHDKDQFQQLKQLICGKMARPATALKIRLENAGHLRDYLLEAVSGQVSRDFPWLQKALESAADLEAKALEQSLQALETDSETMTQGTGIRLYQLLARGWWGPVGWVLALWSRLLIFGAGAISVLRPGRPLHQAAGLASALRHRAASKIKLNRAADATAATAAAQAFQTAVLRHWPRTADYLVKARFDHQVRDSRPPARAAIELADSITQAWAVALDRRLQKAAGRLQNGLFQALINLPCLAALAYAGWLTLKNFFLGSYLPSDFFIHFLATEIILVLTGFFILQAAVQFTVRRGRLQRQAFAQLQTTVSDRKTLSGIKALAQARSILELPAEHFLPAGKHNNNIPA